MHSRVRQVDGDRGYLVRKYKSGVQSIGMGCGISLMKSLATGWHIGSMKQEIISRFCSVICFRDTMTILSAFPQGTNKQQFRKPDVSSQKSDDTHRISHCCDNAAPASC